jgi:hypothetical protein
MTDYELSRAARCDPAPDVSLRERRQYSEGNREAAFPKKERGPSASAPSRGWGPAPLIKETAAGRYCNRAIALWLRLAGGAAPQAGGE